MRILVRRAGTEGLPTADYTAELRECLPDHEIRHARTPGAERAAIAEAEVVTGNDINAALLGRAEALELFACTYAGTDHLPLDVLAAHGVAVTNASGIHAPGIAEGVIGAILSFARDLHRGWRQEETGVATLPAGGNSRDRP